VIILMISEGKTLEKTCKYAKLVRAKDNSSSRDDILFCDNLEAAINNNYIENGCVASKVFPTGHSKLDAYFAPEEMEQCPYRTK